MNSDVLYRNLFEHMINGFAHCEVVYKGNIAVDWIYLKVNPKFELLTGLKDVEGRLVSEVIPGIHRDNPELLEMYSAVAETMVADYIEVHIKELLMWFSVTAFSHKKNTFTTVFENTTLRKAMEHEIRQKNIILSETLDETIEAWAIALELRDIETLGHSSRVVEIALRLGRQLGIDEEQIGVLKRGGLLHDIGKMGIPDAILLKKDALTLEETEIIKTHPRIAYEMLHKIPLLDPIRDIPYCHHERWNGTGYPQGLLGERIPRLARIFAIVDVYDALTSDRPYREAWSKSRAIAYIANERGISFDPEVADAFVGMMEED